ncbi:hypothetical protein FQN60_006619, partial [Etheostoma spectabile]
MVSKQDALQPLILQKGRDGVCFCYTTSKYCMPIGLSPLCSDETQFRNCIVWLEDQKIRHYKIEDRGNLRNIPSSDWPKAYQKYLQDLNCPFGVEEKQEALDWLLGLSVRYEYGDNGKMAGCVHLLWYWQQCLTLAKYKDCKPLAAPGNSEEKAGDPLLNLDSSSPDFKAGVTALANILKIQRHDDYLVMLKAIRILIQERLSPEAISKASQSTEGIPVALDKHVLGFDTGDATLNEAAQILRLLHIEELRELQTKINEAIVAVQAIIADPKTDHRLGK